MATVAGVGAGAGAGAGAAFFLGGGASSSSSDSDSVSEQSNKCGNGGNQDDHGSSPIRKEVQLSNLDKCIRDLRGE